jgi:hypothetical protein
MVAFLCVDWFLAKQTHRRPPHGAPCFFPPPQSRSAGLWKCRPVDSPWKQKAVSTACPQGLEKCSNGRALFHSSTATTTREMESFFLFPFSLKVGLKPLAKRRPLSQPPATQPPPRHPTPREQGGTMYLPFTCVRHSGGSSFVACGGEDLTGVPARRGPWRPGGVRSARYP